MLIQPEKLNGEEKYMTWHMEKNDNEIETLLKSCFEFQVYCLFSNFFFDFKLQFFARNLANEKFSVHAANSKENFHDQ